ncbi:MAG: fructosamine kinase family protein [Polyangiales bacterium]
MRRAIALELGSTVARVRPVSGGDINDAYEVELAEGQIVFVKTHDTAPSSMFAAEAHGLDWLRMASKIRLPRVLGVGPGSPAYLALEWVDPAPRVGDFDEILGRSLAGLHGHGAKAFGLGRDNYIGRLPQKNSQRETWSEFYWTCRLEPQIRLAQDRGRLSEPVLRSFEVLSRNLADRVGPPEPPSRLHGDLWAGNLHVDDRGMPCLVDPAAYAGHREVDLAMMRLFGGFTERVFDAYHEVTPLAPGAASRVPLYQLYPLLVHLNLFGGSYAHSIEHALTTCV